MKIFKILSKRGLALFLVLTMCMSMIQTTAFAAEAGSTTITTVSDWNGLKAAVENPSASEINITADITFGNNQTITIPSSRSVTISSSSSNTELIKRSANVSIFNVAGNLTLKNITICGATSDAVGNWCQSSLIAVQSGGKLTLDSGATLARSYTNDNNVCGGAVYVEGALEMKDDSCIRDCQTEKDGGGVYVASGGVFTMNGGTIRDCHAAHGDGGGVYLAQGATLTANSGSISGTNGENNEAGKDRSGAAYVAEGAVITGDGANSVFGSGAVYKAVSPKLDGVPMVVTLIKDPKGIPGEPVVSTQQYLWVTDQYIVGDTDAVFSGNAAGYISPEIFIDPNFKSNDNGGAEGVYATGTKYLKGIDWDRVLDAVVGKELKASDGQILATENKDQYEVLPYVVKYQSASGNSYGWHVDCEIVPKGQFTLLYQLNLQDKVDNVDGFVSPAGGTYVNGTAVTVANATYKNDPVLVGENREISVTKDGKEVSLFFLGWSTSPNGYPQYKPGGTFTITKDTVLYGVWSTEYKLPSLKVAKTVDKAQANVGDEITYTITVTNSGNGAAKGILLTDAFSGAGSLVWTGSDPTAVEFDVAANDSVTFTATYEVVEGDKGQKITNSAVLPGETPDPENPDTEVTVTAPELSVEKKVNGSATATANVGETVTYTITVTNSGTADATNVRIYDGLDSKVEVTGATLNGKDIIPTVNNNAVYVNIGTLTPDSSVELVITATAKVAGIAPNKANVNSEETGAEYSNRVDTLIEDVVVKTITVTWIDGHTDGTIKQETIDEGAAIPANPTAPDHEGDGYRFTGWSAPVTDPVTGNITITANYEPIPADEKINVTWVDGHATEDNILKYLPGKYNKGDTIPTDEYPNDLLRAYEGYTFTGWSTPQVLSNGDIIITANYRTLEVNPEGPTFEELTDLGITVEVVCDTNATHEPVTRSYPLMEGSYETFIADGSCTLVIYNDLYVEAYGGDHSFVGRPAQTIMLEYVGVPATIGDDETASDEIDDVASDTTSEDENTDDVIDNNVDDDTDVTTPDAGIGIGDENGIIADSGEEAGNGDFAGDDSGEAGVGDDNGAANLPGNGSGNADAIQLMSIDAISFSAPAGGWVIAQGYTNTVIFHVRCEQSAPQPETITVTWVDGHTNGRIAQETIDRGAAIPANPTAPDHESVGYEFTGWSDPAEDSDGNVTITANYRPITRYTVTFISRDAVVATGTYRAGEQLTLPANPRSYYVGDYRYDFVHWTPTVEMTVNGDATYTAVFEPTYVGEGPVVPVTPPVTPVTPVTPTPPTTIPDTPTPLDPGTTIPDEEVPLAGAVGLNDVDHFAYIIGYDDDTVRPLNNITRAEVATIFFRLMTDDYRNANWSTTNSFSDVAAGSWYNNAISTCANAGALNGYADGSFKPNASITRAEFAAIAARFLSDEYTDDGTGDFSDTANHWAAKEIRLAAKAGWVQGDGNKFRPNDYITRAEVMTIVNRMLDRVPDADHMLDTMKKWIDNPEDAWYYEAVQEATNEHAYERDEMGVVETWTEILTARDWAALEKGWADANAQ